MGLNFFIREIFFNFTAYFNRKPWMRVNWIVIFHYILVCSE